MGNVSGSSSFYKLGAEAEPEDSSGWCIYDGTSTKDGSLISVFRFSGKGKTKDQVDCATHLLQQSKRLRHPYFLKYFEGREAGTELAFATEKVVPLLKWVAQVREKETKEHIDAAITWGLYCLCNAVAFLNENCSLVHGNLTPESIYVNEQGDWKLGGLSLVGEGVSRLKDYPNWIGIQYKSPERIDNDWSTMDAAPKWSIDAWGIGCVVYEVFNGKVFDASELLKVENVPTRYQKLYKSLLSSTPSKRINPKKLTTHRMFAAHPVVKNMIFLEELHVKTQEEKLAYFRALPSDLDAYPGPAKVKLLDAIGAILAVQPTATVNGAAIPGVGALHAAVLTPMLLVGEKLDDEMFKLRVVPKVLELFSSNDRGTRVTLLQNIDSFIPRIDEDVINKTLFDQLCTGFADTAPILRELTIKAMVSVAPKLNPKNLNEKLVKKFGMLQADKDPAIRTNVLICLGMIFQYFSIESKKSVVTTVFVRAMQDPFHHARLAAVKGISANLGVLKDSADQVTAKVLPLVSVALGDPSPPVRELAFKCMQAALPWLEQASKERAIAQAKEAEQAAQKAKADHEAEQIRLKQQGNNVGEHDNTAPVSRANSFTAASASAGLMKQAAGWAVSSLASRWATSTNESAPTDGERSGQLETGTQQDATHSGANTVPVTEHEVESDFEENPQQAAAAEIRRKQLARRREEQRAKREARKAEAQARKANKSVSILESKPKPQEPAASSAWGEEDDDLDLGFDDDGIQPTKSNSSSIEKVLSTHKTDDFFDQVSTAGATRIKSKTSSGIAGMSLKSKGTVKKLPLDFDEDEWDKW